MQFKAIFTFIAAGLAMVSATKPEDKDIDSTTTSTQTSTMTMTLTVTQCAPGVSSCPGAYPSKNHTATIPTWHGHNSSTVIVIPTGGQTTLIKPTGAAGVPTKSAPAPVATGAASGLVFQSSLMLGLLGAGVALIA